jgi:transcriptional regulator with XRE-family HTH domain
MSNEELSRQAIAARLRLAREMGGLTQGQVAKSLGWHRPTVSEMEAGRRKVSAEELSTLAELYGVNVPWIVGEEAESDTASDRAKLAARELSKLKDEDLDRLLQLIRALKTSGGAP